MSETVSQLLSHIERALDDYVDAERVTRIVESLTSLDGLLSPDLQDLRQAVTAFTALGQVGIAADRPDTASLAAACRHAANAVRQDKSAPQDLHRSLRRINEVVNAAKVTARDTWREYLDGCVPGLDSLNDLAEMLSQMRADKLKVANLRQGVIDLRTLSRRAPDQSAPQEAAAAVAAIHAALTALLGGSDADNDVRHFMVAAGRGGAHVRELTPAVTEWIHRNGLENSFKIVAGRPASE